MGPEVGVNENIALTMTPHLRAVGREEGALGSYRTKQRHAQLGNMYQEHTHVKTTT